MSVLKTILLSSIVLLSNLSFAGGTVFAAKEPIKINGVLDEKCWTQQASLSDFRSKDNKKLELATEVKIARTAYGVYFAAKCAIPAGEDFRAKALPSNGGKGMNKDDCIIFTLYPGSERDNYYAFYVNARGAVWCEYLSQGGFVSNAVDLSHIRSRAVRNLEKKFWTCELYVPFANLKYNQLPGNTWGWNAARMPRYMPETYSLLQGKLFLPDARIDLKGFDLDFSDYMLEVSPVKITYKADKKHQFSFNITNRSKQTLTLRVQSEILKLKKSYMSNRLMLKPGETKTAVLSCSSVVTDGKFRMLLVIKNAQSRKLLKQDIFPIKIDFAPWQTTLLSPCYRNSIFATEKNPQIIIEVNSLVKGKTVAVLSNAQGKKIAEESLTDTGRITFDAQALEVGKYSVTLQGPAVDGIAMKKVFNIAKLAPHQGEVRRDSEGFWLKDGKRIFLIAEWNDVHLDGTNAMQFWRIPKKLKTLHGIAFSLSGSAMRKAHYRNNRTELDKKGKEAVSRTIESQKNYHPLFCWQVADEPEGRGSGVKYEFYKNLHSYISALDPYHPVSIGTFTSWGMLKYANCAEINFLHPYPIPLLDQPRSCFSKVVDHLNTFETIQKQLKNQAPSMIYLLQGFNYSDLVGGQRVPSYDELRTQAIMSLIAGGQGIMFYNRSAGFYPELSIGTPAMVKELRILEPVMIRSNIKDPAMKCPARPFRWMIKKHNDDLWIFAGSFDASKLQAAMEIPELGTRKLYVFGEKRFIEVKNGKFTDTFNNFDTHIYTTNEKLANSINFADVEKAIRQAYDKRRKPGNLAFQQHENKVLTVSSSSNIFATYRRSSNSALWHVTDGAFKKGDRMYFEAKAPGTGNEYLELKFHKAIEFSKVVVYPLNDSLSDYTVQVKQDGTYKTVSSIKNATGKAQTHTFPSVRSDTVRIQASKSRKAMSIIEIEIYK